MRRTSTVPAQLVQSFALAGVRPIAVHLLATILPERVADGKPARDVLAEPAEGVAHALPHRLERGPAIADLRSVPPDEFVDAVIDGAEEPAPAILLGVEARRVGAPHLIRARGGD